MPPYTGGMNRNLWLLALCQGLFLTNNVAFIAINGLVGLSLAPFGWMATLPVMAYVVGGALSTPLVAHTQTRYGRRVSFQPVFIVACASAALGYGVMNLLMAATPLAMQQCGLSFDDAAFVLEWHVIGMFAPGFFTGGWIKRFGTLPVMGVGVVLNLACIAIALSGVELHQFTIALFLLGVGWNFIFTGSTTLALNAYRPEEKDRAQAAINFCVFAVMAFTSFASGALVTTQGWGLLNWGSLVPVLLMAGTLVWFAAQRGAQGR